MQGKYRKIMVRMEAAGESGQRWRLAHMEPICYVESYKEKRAVFFQGYHLFPGERYHIVLIGNEAGEMIHEDFGPIHTGGNGELQCYRTFTGPALEAFDFCLLCAESDDGQLEIVYKGALFREAASFDFLCREENRVIPFSIEQDETAANWYRHGDFDRLPSWVGVCRPWMEIYGHYIIGRSDSRMFLGVPGRFLQKEQPMRDAGVFLLWQPIRGGEAFFDRADQMTRRQQETIFGYWIAGLDTEQGIFQPL